MDSISNPGTLNAFQLATLLTFLSDETVDNTSLETLQKKLHSAFNSKDHIKVNFFMRLNLNVYIFVLNYAQILFIYCKSLNLRQGYLALFPIQDLFLCS